MIGAPQPFEIEKVKTAYNAEFLNSICNRILKVNSNREEFKDFLIFSSAQYLAMKRMNQNRKTVTEQNNAIDSFINSISNFQKSYQNMRKTDASLSKYHAALRKNLEELPETDVMVKMFDPYITLTKGNNLGGTSIDFFERFLEFMQQAALDAKELRYPNERTDITKNILTWWAARIKFRLDEVSNINFVLGDYIKEINSYKSEALDILFDLMNPVDDKITRRSIATSMQEINKLNQIPASFLIS